MLKERKTDKKISGWRGAWSCCCRRIPQSAPKGLFEKILLLNPAAPYKEGPVLSHSPPLQLDRGLCGSGSHMAQLSILSCQRPRSLWVYHFILIPLPATSSNQVSLCAARTLFGRGVSSQLSSVPGVLQQAQGARGLGLQLPWSQHWSQGSFFFPEAIPLPSVFSVSSIRFVLLFS